MTAAMADKQPALATTKRKFHKLLDNLAASTSTTSLASSLPASNASTVSLDHPPSPEPPSKRPRSAHASSVSLERQRSISAGQERIRALKEQLLTPRRECTIKVVGNTQTPTDTTPRKAPNFQPYSQEQFLARLKTFADVKKWTSKPDGIREVEWAKRGWSCDTWNTVACKGGCEKRIAVKLRPKRKDASGKEIDMTEDLSTPFDNGLVERYQDLIVNGHHEDCLWRKRGCSGKTRTIPQRHSNTKLTLPTDDIYHIPIASRAASTSALLSRYHSFTPLAHDLPLPSNILHPSPSTPYILSRLPPTFFSPDTAPSTPSQTTAFAFALFGWTGIIESRISLAVCTHCFQRLGLWLSSDTRLKEMSAKLSVPIDSLRLNLLESHREHCPWKNGVVQANPPDGPIAHMPAWQTLQFILLGKKRELHTNTTRHTRQSASADLDTADYPRGSIDSGDSSRPKSRDGEAEAEAETESSLQDKWRKFKAKLRRTTSKKSLKDAKSIKSVKSVKSAKSAKSSTTRKGKDGDKENEAL